MREALPCFGVIMRGLFLVCVYGVTLEAIAKRDRPSWSVFRDCALPSIIFLQKPSFCEIDKINA